MIYSTFSASVQHIQISSEFRRLRREITARKFMPAFSCGSPRAQAQDVYSGTFFLKAGDYTSKMKSSPAL